MTAVPSPRDGRPRLRPEDLGSAGTAGRGYRCPPDPHPFTPEPADHGRRPVCAVCQRNEHSEVTA